MFYSEEDGRKGSATYRNHVMASGANKQSLLLKLTNLRSQNPHPPSSSLLRRPSAGIPAAHEQIRVRL